MFYKYLIWNPNAEQLLASHSFYYTDPRTFNDIHECVIRPQDNSNLSNHDAITFDAKTSYQIYCLSKSKNHPLMWAHYANSYRGISLEFDFVAGDNHFNKPQQVKYQHSPPIITDNELCSGTDISEKVFGYKHSQWEYEQEWRIFKLANTSPIVPFLPQSLKKVYLGPVPLSSDIFNEVYSKLSNYNSVNNTTVKLIRLKRDTWSYNVIEDIIF